jgi:hypothetical protein
VATGAALRAQLREAVAALEAGGVPLPEGVRDGGCASSNVPAQVRRRCVTQDVTYVSRLSGCRLGTPRRLGARVAALQLYAWHARQRTSCGCTAVVTTLQCLQLREKEREVHALAKQLEAVREDGASARREVAACKAQLARKGLVAERQRNALEEAQLAERERLRADVAQQQSKVKALEYTMQALQREVGQLRGVVRERAREVQGAEEEAARWRRRTAARNTPQLVAQCVLQVHVPGGC